MPARGGDGTPLASLSPTERRVLRLVAEYKTSKEIADALFISIRTVDRHRANIASKLDLTGAARPAAIRQRSTRPSSRACDPLRG